MVKRKAQDDDEDTGTGGGEELSHRKKDRSEGGGGLADDIDCTIVSARLSMRSRSNYQEAAGDGDGVCCLMVKYESQVEGFESFTEYYSSGKNVVPMDKGKRMGRAPGMKGDFNASTKMARFLDSLTDSGLAEDDQYPFDKLDGLNVHVNRKADEKREGLEDDGRNKKRSILIVTDLLDEAPAPAKGKAKKKAAADDDDDEDEDDAPKSKAKAKKPADDDDEDDSDDDEDEAPKSAKGNANTKKAIAVIAKVAKAGPHDDVADVYQAAFRALKGDEARGDIMRDLLNEDDLPAFLKAHAEAGGWKFVKGKLSEAE